MSRPTWNEYFMNYAELAATRVVCKRRKVGAALVKDNYVLATGYNGPPKNTDHCKVCLRSKMNIPSGERHELCRGLHAEQNAIIQAAYHGISIKDSILYVTHSPCGICTKMLINAGIKTIIYKEGYSDDMGIDLINEYNKNVGTFVSIEPVLQVIKFEDLKKR